MYIAILLYICNVLELYASFHTLKLTEYIALVPRKALKYCTVFEVRCEDGNFSGALPLI